MSSIIQAVRGMNDILPEEVSLWQHVENTIQEVLKSFCYDEIRFPIVEKTELFKRSIGEVTDIVEKEMYTFIDRNEESLTLRPEGTAGCVRTVIEHGLIHNQIQRLWYKGPFFRHERPQKGRTRQFHQCGVEIFGIPTPDIDAELILLSATIFERLGFKDHIALQINSLGSPASRAKYKETLIAYLTKHTDQLDEDSKRRLNTNPLRILDSKNPAMADLIHHAPKLTESLDDESRLHFEGLLNYLNALNIKYEINPCLVRGLDYYTKTVFEWVTTDLGAQGTVCAGGRYDGLVEQLGGKPTPALGFGLGLERTVLLLQTLHQKSLALAPDIYFIADSEKTLETAFALSNSLRKALPEIRILMNCGGGAIKNQLKKADKSGARYALILGEQEAANQSIVLKNLRENNPQEIFPQQQIIEKLSGLLN